MTAAAGLKVRAGIHRAILELAVPKKFSLRSPSRTKPWRSSSLFDAVLRGSVTASMLWNRKRSNPRYTAAPALRSSSLGPSVRSPACSRSAMMLQFQAVVADGADHCIVTMQGECPGDACVLRAILGDSSADQLLRILQGGRAVAGRCAPSRSSARRVKRARQSEGTSSRRCKRAVVRIGRSTGQGEHRPKEAHLVLRP